MPLAKRLSSKFHSCPRNFDSWPTVHFSDNLSASGIILQYTSRLKVFTFTNTSSKGFLGVLIFGELTFGGAYGGKFASQDELGLNIKTA